MAATDSLRALTAAALALPGLTPAAHAAAGDNEASINYGHYEEGPRQVIPDSKTYDPMRIDTLSATAKTRLSERVTFGFDYIQDTWSGATPITTAPIGAMEPALVSGASTFVRQQMMVDSDLNTYGADIDLDTGLYTKEPGIVHMMTSASPETRKQAAIKFGFERENSTIDIGGGVSHEDDYDSRYVNLGGKRDLNNKLTTLSAGISHTHSSSASTISSRFDPYIDEGAYAADVELVPIAGGGVSRVIHGHRNDWALRAGISQVLTKNSAVETGIGFTRSTGFQENAYKAVVMGFVDPTQTPDDQGLYVAEMVPVMEKRPDERSQWSWNARYMRYFENFDAATHLEYRFYRDNWGIRSHTIEGDWVQPLGNGWSVTPRVRYYSQSAADFYRPYFMFNQAKPTTYISDEDPEHFDATQIPLGSYSSDHRLSAFGALSRGVIFSKQFARGVNVDLGLEYYTHRGTSKIGNGGEGAYADFDSFGINAGLRVDLSSSGSFLDSALPSGEHGAHTQHGEHAHHARAPAGVMYDHMLTKSGDTMLGYRYMYMRQAGSMLRGSGPTDDLRVVANACGDINCAMTAKEHTMHMHMLDFMYAPSDRMTLMLMPQFVDMNMELRALDGADSGHNHAGHSQHATGGMGDTLVAALVNLGDYGRHHIHAGLGVSIPTGSIDQKIENEEMDPDTGEHNGVDELVHYGMQLGSGTWDFIPSLTYTGAAERWSWGAQASSTQRFRSLKSVSEYNDSGFAFGDNVQTTIWGGYNVTPSVTASLRGSYTWQDKVQGRYTQPHMEMAPMDFPQNYGGQFYDIGIGVSANIGSGEFKGHRLAVEWLEPVREDIYGFQLERSGTLNASWSIPL